MSADQNPPIDQETRKALQEKWAAGREADEAAEKRAAEKRAETGEESPERKRLAERLSELKSRIRETWQEFFGSKPVEDANLEKRYGEGMNDAEKAEDAALVAQGDKERERAEAVVTELAEHGEPRRPASETPVHGALRSEAEKRAPEDEKTGAVFEMARADIDAAVKRLDEKLETSLEEYGGRRVVRVTHAERPDVSWLVPVGAYAEREGAAESGGGLADYLNTSLHKTYNEKMAKSDAAAAAKAAHEAEAWKKAEAAIEAVGQEQVDAEKRESAAARAAKLARQHEIMLDREADIESRVAMIEDVRAGRLQRDDLEPAQIKWLGKELTDDKAFNLLKRELADLKSRRTGAASELGLPAEKPSEKSEPANIVVGEEEKPVKPLTPRDTYPNLPEPAPGSLPPGVPDKDSPMPKPGAPGVPAPPDGEIVRLKSVLHGKTELKPRVRKEEAPKAEEKPAEPEAVPAAVAAPRIEIAPPKPRVKKEKPAPAPDPAPEAAPAAETAAALGVAAKIGELAAEAGKEQEKREQEAAKLMKDVLKAYPAAWKGIRESVIATGGDAATIEGLKSMRDNAIALGAREDELLKKAAGMGLLAPEDVEAFVGTSAAKEIHRLYVRLHEDALREAEKLAAKGPGATEKAPAAEAERQAPKEEKRRINASRYANDADFLVKRWAELGAAGRPNSKMEESFNALYAQLGGDATPEGKAFGDFLGALMEKHEAIAKGASEDEIKKLDDAARKAFVKFRDLAEPRKPAEPRKRGGRARGGHGRKPAQKR